jgi:xanthine/CO dehydrogenase XdhC/CoxF family maturation factor
MTIQDSETLVWVDYRPARPSLWIFGAGDDAQPLLRLAKGLGWYVGVADGRSHLVTRERFPLADELASLPIENLPANGSAGPFQVFAKLRAQDAAAVLTHNFEQDARILASLLVLDAPLAYIGVLGPQRRTRELLAEAARLLGLLANPEDDRVEHWLEQLHAPMGLDLGAESPEAIAFSIVAEVQKSLTAASALPLRLVRAIAPLNVR